jgi:hypothetical protein
MIFFKLISFYLYRHEESNKKSLFFYIDQVLLLRAMWNESFMHNFERKKRMSNFSFRL